MKTFRILFLSLAPLFVAGLRSQFATANVESSAGTHDGALTRRADAAHSYTHLLVKYGSDDGHVAVCGAGNYPVGITTDQPDAAEDLLNVLPLGSGKGTRKIRVATALTEDIDLYTAANGFAQAEPGTAGTYYLIGRSAGAAVQVDSGNYLIEFTPRAPVKLTVIAAATGTAATDIAAIFTAIATPTLLKHA